MYRFVVLERHIAAREIVPTGREIMIGRNLDFPIALRDRWVSRKHAVVRRIKDRLWIEDLGSKTGTYVNGRRLQPGRIVPLKDGDVIVCGASSVVCLWSPGREKSPGLIRSSDDQRLVAGMNARLVVCTHQSIRAWPVARTSTVVGSDKSADITVEEEGVEPRHVRILFVGGRFYAENVSECAGIVLNGRQIQTEKLPTNSSLVFGLAQALFLYDYEPDGRPPGDPINTLRSKQFRRFLVLRAGLSAKQISRLNTEKPRSNLELGELAVRFGFLAPAFWRSLCEAARLELRPARLGRLAGSLCFWRRRL